MRDVSLKGRLALHSQNAFKLGLFGANCSSGAAFITKVPERWSADWQEMHQVALIADKAGIEFLLPIARWKGYGGEIDFQGSTLETITWATGLLGKTENITCYATVHVPLFHPVAAAKQFMVADHVGGGRFGLNIVCGWNEGEFDMFGVDLKEHEARYDYAQEWIDIVLNCWAPTEEFDFNGKYFHLKAVRSKPKPFGGTRPIFMNAGNSPTGQDFAAKNCDAYFGRVRPEFMKEDADKILRIKTHGASLGREIDVFTAGTVVCRPTQKEADEYVHYCAVENPDWGAVDNMLRLQSVNLDAMSKEERETTRTRRALGMGGLPIAGTPDFIAERFAQLHAVGLRGYAVGFVNYLRELPYFAAEVIPRLEKRGLRVKA
jgi:alkanesulfonate monooxygenase SsuD/methylene tetrahydromethanopterin reductase-like flavin-dependent oxidoreductase (luciferase family)